MPYFSITEDHAKLEGEGDGSLLYWKKNKWEYYQRKLGEFNRKPNDSMIVVCEYFEKVF